jgi:uncharacterized FAD-dependent dehydrogenase
MVGQDPCETNCLILAIGASARDTFQALVGSGVALESKPFQMGLRIEHPRELIDRAVLGPAAGHPRAGAAEYVLNAESVTTFCVCPGGVIVPASVEPGTVCTNGMSDSAREGAFTNSGLVTTLPTDAFGNEALAGVEFQRHWEREGFRAGGGDYAIPAQAAPDFLAGRIRPLPRRTTYPFGATPARLDSVLPAGVADAIRQALPAFEKRISGFSGPEGVLAGPEARVSCPIRMVRDRIRRVSVSVDGLFPAGEGSGYASGILSSALDGLRSAEAVVRRFAVPRT